MVNPARFKFVATLLVAVLAGVLTVLDPGDDEAAASLHHTASLLPPFQR